jgi:hypothetical protein
MVSPRHFWNACFPCGIKTASTKVEDQADTWQQAEAMGREIARQLGGLMRM